MPKLKITSILFTFVTVLTACGDGDSTTTTPADPFEKEVADAAIETAGRLIESRSVNTPIFPSAASKQPSDSLTVLLQQDRNAHLLEPLVGSAAAEKLVTGSLTETNESNCGGSVTTVTVATADDEVLFPFSSTATSEFSSFCEASDPFSTYFDGVVVVSLSQPDGNNSVFSVDFDLTYTSDIPGKESGRLEFSRTCITANRSVSCAESFPYESSSGADYSLNEPSLTGDNDSGFGVEGSITDDLDNTYDVSFTGLLVCDNGYFGAGGGTIVVNGDEEISVDSISCDKYVVTYQGVSKTYSHTD